MPCRNGKGPMYQGPRTGGGFGGCPTDPEAVGEGADRASAYGLGRGGRPWGGRRGRCFGAGRGRMAGVPQSPEVTAQQERTHLENQATILQEQIAAVKNRLEELTPNEQEDES